MEGSAVVGPPTIARAVTKFHAHEYDTLESEEPETLSSPSTNSQSQQPPHVLETIRQLKKSEFVRRVNAPEKVTVCMIPSSDLDKRGLLLAAPSGQSHLAVWKKHGFVVMKKQTVSYVSPNTDPLGELARILQIPPHSNITPTLGLSIDFDRSSCLIYRIAPKGSLDHLLDKWNIDIELQKDTKKLWTIAREFALGVAHMHRNRLVHGDLTLCSLLVGENDEIMLADYGFSVGLQRNSTEAKLLPNVALPFRSAAPETIRSNVVSPKTDVYMFGMTLLELAGKGNHPLSHIQSLSEMQANFAEEGAADAFCRGIPCPKECPLKLRKMIYWCLDSDPETRPSMEDVLGRIDEAIRQRDTST